MVQLGNSVTNRDEVNNWWKKDAKDASLDIFSMLRHWDTTQSGIQSTNVRNLRLYSNREVQSLSIAQYVLTNSANEYTSSGIFGNSLSSRPNRLTLNVIKSCVDSWRAKICKNKIKPTFLTSGGTIEQKMRAEKMNKFLFGVFHEGDVWRKNSLAARDGGIFGNGFVKVYKDENKRIAFDRIFPDEIMCDPADSYYGEPKALFQRKFVSRDALTGFIGNKVGGYKVTEDDVNKVQNVACNMSGGSIQDTVLLCESWRLGTAGNNRRMICADGLPLLDEEWNRKRFPFAKYQYTEPVLGYFGTGIPEEIAGIQIEINRLLLHVQETLRLMSYPRIFIENGSKINAKHFTNEVGTIIPYSGTPPIFSVINAVAPEIFQQIERLYSRAYEIVGISQLSAIGQKPSGITAAVALQELNDIETERFAITARAWEDLHVAEAELVLEELEHSPGYSVSTHSRDCGVEGIKWADIKLPKDEYVVQCFPSSALPKQPAARLSIVQDMINTGFIDKEEGQELLDFPDLDAFNRRALSPLRIAVKMVEKAIFDKKLIMPEPYMNVQLAQKIAQQYYCWGLTEEVEDANLDILRQFIDACKELNAMALPPPSDMGVPTPVAPTQSTALPMAPA